MKTGLILLVAVAAFATAGCHGGVSGDGTNPQAQQQASSISEIAKRVGGNYDSLTADEKQKFLGIANGNEKQARNVCYLMAHPMSEVNQRNHPGAATGR